MIRKIAAEALGTALLLAIVVESGIMGETLSPANDAMALLGNTLSTACGLAVLILIFGPVSGAHFNPAVTAAFLIRREISIAIAGAYMLAQLAGGALGVLLAHAMFDLDLFQLSARARAGGGQAMGEATATFLLLLTIIRGAGRLALRQSLTRSGLSLRRAIGSPPRHRSQTRR